MEQLRYSTQINAPKEKVWHTMLDDETYPKWTDVFMPGSYYEGSWEKGSKILFLAPNEDGKPEGMVAQIVESKPYDFVSIEHQGQVRDGVEDTTSDEVKAWVGAHENYTFTEKDGGTEVVVDLEGIAGEDFIAMFNDMWPKALAKLKTIAEA